MTIVWLVYFVAKTRWRIACLILIELFLILHLWSLVDICWFDHFDWRLFPVFCDELSLTALISFWWTFIKFCFWLLFASCLFLDWFMSFSFTTNNLFWIILIWIWLLFVWISVALNICQWFNKKFSVHWFLDQYLQQIS